MGQSCFSPHRCLPSKIKPRPRGICGPACKEGMLLGEQFCTPHRLSRVGHASPFTYSSDKP